VYEQDDWFLVDERTQHFRPLMNDEYGNSAIAELVGLISLTSQDRGPHHMARYSREPGEMWSSIPYSVLSDVILIHNTEKDPKLPAGKIDMILMVDVYHELSYPYEVMGELVKALKPGGRIVFVEFRLEDKKVPILDVHRMSIKQVMAEMAPFKDMKHAKTLNHLPWQHVIIFEKVEEKKETPELNKRP